MKDFIIDEQFIFDMHNLSALQDISKENLIANDGTLTLSFYDMLSTLNKHNIIPRILILCKENEGLIGYCMFYSCNGNIHISHICVKNKYQRMGGGQFIIDWIKHCKANAITADVYYDNHKSQKFFEKMRFTFENNEEKKRWRVSFKL